MCSLLVLYISSCYKYLINRDLNFQTKVTSLCVRGLYVLNDSCENRNNHDLLGEALIPLVAWSLDKTNVHILGKELVK